MQRRYDTLPLVRSGVRRAGVFEALAVASILIVGPMAGAALAAPDAAFVLDAKTDKVLYSSNADAPRHPASLTKMMTLYMLFDAISKGKASLDSQIPVSAHAAAQAPSKLDLQPGQSISARDAILAIVTRSANDVAVAIAEYVGGSEKNFCAMMTERARQMGMRSTTFVNASGLPDERQITTARDLATLALALRQHFPQYYSYFSTPSFVWRGHRIVNHDRLLGRVAGVNGIKTGYTRASGFNLATSVERDNRMVVGIVLGGETGRERDNRMAALMEKYVPAASRGAMVARLVPGGPRQLVQPKIASVAAAALPIPRIRPTSDDMVAAAVSVPMPKPAPETDVPQATASIATASAQPTDAPKSAPLPINDTTTVASLIGANSPLALQALDDPETPATRAAAAQAGNGASVADAPPPAQPAATPDAVATQVAEATQADATPATSDDASDQGDAGANDDSADATRPDNHPGWRIQIAAAPTQAGAEDMLDRALSRGGKVLAHASPYTEPVKSGSGTVYRARFAGFSSKEAARSACNFLVRHKFSCLAVGNN
jgi:D-alanyl-D-alanine carboxypeptidase